MKVDKGIPMPGRYPFDEMEIGDSFLLPPNTKLISAQVAALRFRKKTGKYFSFRKMPDGIRVWRVK